VAEKQNIPLKLKVMADYCSSGIWVIRQEGSFLHGMIHHDHLGLPPKLAQQFDEWIIDYTTLLEIPKVPFDTLAFNTKGRMLASALKHFLGPEWSVEYMPEREEGGIGPAEVIE
jgi:hypothetical protein